MVTIAVVVAALKALVVLSILIFIIGLIKPKWVLFWMKEPSRFLISGIALVLFMSAMTGWSHFTVHPKPKSEKDRTQDEINELNLGPAEKH